MFLDCLKAGEFLHAPCPPLLRCPSGVAHYHRFPANFLQRISNLAKELILLLLGQLKPGFRQSEIKHFVNGLRHRYIPYLIEGHFTITIQRLKVKNNMQFYGRRMCPERDAEMLISTRG